METKVTKVLILNSLLLLSINSISQINKQYWLKQALNSTCYLVAGFLDGQAEIIKNDYRRYENIHPSANAFWANPKLSFRNKYKDYPTDKTRAYIGSKTWLAWTTDKYHLNRTIRNVFVAGGVGVSMSLYTKPNFKQIMAQAVISWGCFAAGSGLAHAIYRPID